MEIVFKICLALLISLYLYIFYIYIILLLTYPVLNMGYLMDYEYCILCHITSLSRYMLFLDFQIF